MWKIIIVNDGSIDNSAKILRELMGCHPELRVVCLLRHSGQSAALEAGFRLCQGKYIATLDADLQNDPLDILPLLKKVAGGECDFYGEYNLLPKPGINLSRKAFKTAMYFEHG